jgi:hypothetical protein
MVAELQAMLRGPMADSSSSVSGGSEGHCCLGTFVAIVEGSAVGESVLKSCTAPYCCLGALNVSAVWALVGEEWAACNCMTASPVCTRVLQGLWANVSVCLAVLLPAYVDAFYGRCLRL